MKIPALQRVKREGRRIGAYYVWAPGGKRVNLGTQDAIEAQRRARRVAKGERKFAPDASMERKPRNTWSSASLDSPAAESGGAADKLIAALSGGANSQPPPAASDSSTPAAGAEPQPPPALEPEIIPPDDGAHPPPPWTDAVRDAAAAGASASESAGTAGAPPAIDPEITDAELAKLGVEAQLWIATTYARHKVWKGFSPPVVPPEAREPLIEQWKKVLSYCGVATVLPPWVMGLVVPVVALCTATTAMAYGFAEVAKEQRREAGAAADEQPPADKAGLAAA